MWLITEPRSVSRSVVCFLGRLLCCYHFLQTCSRSTCPMSTSYNATWTTYYNSLLTYPSHVDVFYESFLSSLPKSTWVILCSAFFFVYFFVFNMVMILV